MDSELPQSEAGRPADAADRPSAEAVAAVEHDVYDALAVIIARAQLLSRRLIAGRAEPADVVAGLATIERAARRITGGLSRLAEGSGPPPPDAPPDARGARSDPPPNS